MNFEDIEMDKEMEKVVHSTLGEPMPKGNSMEIFESGFDRFWSAWPKNPRKGAKSECRIETRLKKCCSDSGLVKRMIRLRKRIAMMTSANRVIMTRKLTKDWKRVLEFEFEELLEVTFKAENASS